MHPTEDTPQERDEKAEVLARDLRHFRWEIRVYYIALFVIVILREVS